MEIKFRNADLDRLEIDPGFTCGFPPEAVAAYRRRLQVIRSAKDERDLRAFKSWRYKKMRGDRSHQRSIRLNDQWRLVVEIKASHPSSLVLIASIEDYH